ncbi:RNase H family protein [Vibrio artabrorum]|uniref:RNase H type-1 domain-containing protein n=1 Tax=Vibrio artabrorum TaxID=446374 RepID=A0ABT8CKF3_9VIBR|nr:MULTISPECIES: RNase H family protein [Vibrio]MDN3701009.1 hypothetical protein [Vibrio artabrorum]TCT65843.1 RNase H superfamily protein [Vibrio crassostreae]
MSYSIYIGAAPNNQHGCTQGGIGIPAFNEDGEVEYQDSITIRRSTTNAELELMALIEGLEYAQDGDVIYSDSDFCVKGYNGWLGNNISSGRGQTNLFFMCLYL